MVLIPELLCPAGNMERLITCLTYGADAIYLGGDQFNLRAKGSNFSLENLKKAISLIKKHKKIHRTARSGGNRKSYDFN